MSTSEHDLTVTYVYDVTIVEPLRGLCDLEAVLSNLEATFPGRVNRYPSGAILLESQPCIRAFELRVGGLYHNFAYSIDDSYALYSNKSVLGRMGFTSLKVFPDWRFEIHFMERSARKLEGSTIYVTTERKTGGALREPDPREQNISFCFRQKLKVYDRQLIAATVSRWLKSVSLQGLFGEGPIRPSATNIEFGAKYARLRVDVSASGMCSLMALFLEFIAHLDRLLLEEVNFTGHELHYDPNSVPRQKVIPIEDIHGPVLAELPIDTDAVASETNSN